MASSSRFSAKWFSMKRRSALFIWVVFVVSGGCGLFIVAFFFFLFMRMRGCVTSWTVPVRGTEGYTSEIYSVNDADGLSFMLVLSTHSPEAHVWLRELGQRVYAEDVVLESPWKGRMTKCVLEQGEEKRENVYFRDFAVDKITGFKRVEGGSLAVSLLGDSSGGGVVITCVDPEKSRVLLDIGVGGLVQLFNVKVSRCERVFVTEKSGVRKVERDLVPPAACPSPPPQPLGPPQKPTKWICITCNYINYPGMSVCRGCSLQRKQGPLKGSAWNFRFDSIPKRSFERLPQWQCFACGHRDNFYFSQSETCVKCGAKKTKEEKKPGKLLLAKEDAPREKRAPQKEPSRPAQREPEPRRRSWPVLPHSQPAATGCRRLQGKMRRRRTPGSAARRTGRCASCPRWRRRRSPCSRAPRA